MSFAFRPISRALALAFGGVAGAVMVAPGALAQQQPSGESQKLERVEVTGSLIRRIDTEMALPVVNLNVSELQKAGASNAEQALSFVTQNQVGTPTSRSVSGTNGGAAYANLRNLGSSRTLVLLNGKRIVNQPYNSAAVDLNTLPSVALDRIEVLADGASAIYGTDAIAGVVNFITRKEYEGVSVGGEVQIPEQGGGEVYVANLLGGYGNLTSQGWNVYGGLSFRRQQPLNGTERGFMETSYIPSRGFNGTSPTTFPGNYSQTVSGRATVPTTNPYAPGCFPPSSIPTTSQTACFADTQLWTNVVPSTDQWSAFGKGTLALGANNTLSAEYFWANQVLSNQIAPSPETSGLNMSPNSPFYPGRGITPLTNTNLVTNQPISVGWRTTVLGPRQTDQENTTQRAVLTLDGNAAGWDYTANALWSSATITNTFTNGWPKTQALRNGMSGAAGAPWLNPFGDQTAAGLAYMQANQVLGEMQNITGTLWSLNGVASTQFGELPGGPMSLALGAEYRAEDNKFVTNVAEVSQAASSGLAGAGALREGDRNLWAAMLEMNFPILKNLDLGVAVRYDDYSDFGNTTNPKVSLRWQPIEQLLLRGSYNTGFAAPTLENLYAPNATTFTANRYSDPVLCPGGTVNTAAGGIQSRDCGIQFQRLTGGNENLKAESSDAWTVGFVLQATREISFSLDYWNYKITDSIGSLTETAIFGDPVKYANLFVRCSDPSIPAARKNTIPGCNIPGGDPLAYITNTFLNLGDIKTSGIDGAFSWTGGATEWGSFSFNLRGTYVTKYEFQVEPNGIWYNPVGNYNSQFGGPVIRYRQFANLGWQMGAWTANLFNSFSAGYFDQNNAASVSAPYRQNSVGNTSVWTLSGSYSGIKGLTLQAGVINLFNSDPPFSNQTGNFGARGYDDRFASPLGRTWQLAARYSF